MTKVTILKSGGYRKTAGSSFGELYAVLKMNGRGPGKVKVQYELLTADGKKLDSVEDIIKVGAGQDMIKVSTKLIRLPAVAKRVRLRVLTNEPMPKADDVTISGVVVRKGVGHDRPVITGHYVAHGDTDVYGFRAVCFDAAGHAVVAHGLAKDKGAKSGDFKVTLGAAPSGWQPSSCYVGQSGLSG